MKRHGRQLEGEPYREHQATERQDHHAAASGADVRHLRELQRHARQVARAEDAGQEAQAIEHDAGGAGAIHRILEGRLRTRLAALEQAGEGVRRHARHFDRHEHHEQMVCRRHQAHAERAAEHERVEVRAVFAVGNLRHLREQNVEHEEAHQEQANVGRQRVVHEQTGEQFLPAGEEVAPRGKRLEIAPGIPQPEGYAAERHEG